MNGLELESTRFYLLNQAIFSLIPTLKLLRLQKEKIDFLLALCESLCNEKDNIDLSILDKTVVSILDLNNLAEIESLSGISSFTILESCGSQEPVNDIPEKNDLTAFNVLQDDDNKLSFMGLYR